MGRVPGFALQADSLIGSIPIFSTKQLGALADVVIAMVWRIMELGSIPRGTTKQSIEV